MREKPYNPRVPDGRLFGPGHPPSGVPADAHWLTEAQFQYGIQLATGRAHTLIVPNPKLELTGPAEKTLWITHQGTPDHGARMPDASGFRVQVVGIQEERTPQTDFTWTARLTYRTLEFEPQTHVVEFSATARGAQAPADLFRRAPGRIVEPGDHPVHTDADRQTVAAGGQLVLRVAATFPYAGRQYPLTAELGGYAVLAGDNAPFAALRPVLRQHVEAVMQRNPVWPPGAAPGAQTLTLGPEDADWLASILCVETESGDAVRQFRTETRPARMVHGHGRRSKQDASGTLQLIIKGHPVMNANVGDGGAGLGQITDPAAGPAELWDWRANAKAAVAIYCSKARFASIYVNQVRATLAGDPDASAHAIVRAVNEHRRQLGQPALARIDVPLMTPRQMRDDMARGYNGFVKTTELPGQFAPRLHEYRLAVDGDPPARLRVENVRQEGRDWVGDAVWTQVAETERPGHWERGGWVPRFGRANYVRLMHEAPCAAGRVG